MTSDDPFAELSELDPAARAERLREIVRPLELRERFSLLHRLEVYRHPESLSGAGSTLAETAALREALPELFERHGVRSLLDLPCGDFHWMKTVDLTGVDYVGVDVVEEIVESNRRLHGGEGRRFLLADGTVDELPSVDLVLCRDLVVHLSLDDIRRLLSNLVRRGSRLLLVTHFPSAEVNEDIVSGDFRPVDLRREPFGLPEPEEILEERSHMEDGAFADRSMALWRMDDVARALA